jgi:hypothetical protein
MATSVAAQAKGDLAALVERSERAIDALFLPAARALGEAAAAGGAGPMTWDRRREVLRSADAVLDRLYGRRRGDRGPMYQIVAEHAVAGFVAPLAREAARVAGVLRDRDETALLAAVLLAA